MAAKAEAQDMASALINIDEADRYQLPEEDEEVKGGVPDLPGILRRIKEVARVLDNFKDLRDSKRSRSEYMEQVSGLHTGANCCCAMSKGSQLSPMSQGIHTSLSAAFV